MAFGAGRVLLVAVRSTYGPKVSGTCNGQYPRDSCSESSSKRAALDWHVWGVFAIAIRPRPSYVRGQR